MTCAACGAQLDAGTRFCPSCGAPQRSACGTCGATVPPEARFCPSCGGAVPGEALPEARERKVATLLFADLVGFTSLGEAKDPEVVQALVSRAFERLSEEVRRYEGLVEKFAGDAMLAVFGLPVTHEDDAERAVRAALEMQQAMGELAGQLGREGQAPLALRIGIETGEVVADLGRASAERDRLVTGDAVNTAARLQQAAGPGEVVVGPGTWAATRELVVYDQLEPITLKGKAVPVPAWRAVSVRTRRGGERPVLGLEAPLIGRDEELALLKETVRRTVNEGRPHLVTVLGSAGVGKSRLTWELEKYLDGLPESYHWRKGRCLAYGQVSYSALADAVSVDVKALDDDTREEAARKLDARLGDLAGGEPPEEVRTALRTLLGLAEPGSATRDELFEAWRRYLELIARRFPLVLVLEDIHWADEGLLDFIEFMTRWGEAPIVLLCLARHELLERRPAWGGGLPNAASIVLEPLAASENARLFDGLLGGPIATELRDRVVQAAEGNPLFTEELVRHLVDRGVLRFADGAWQQVAPLASIDIPPTIHALLAARLDSLPPDEKVLSQDAAVVGRIFWDQVLAHVEGQPVSATTGVLRRLRAKELVLPRQPSSLADAAEFSFRHVLIRDVAYESLPKRDRARKHRAVAGWAEQRLSERADELVELLASHYLSALRYEEEFSVDGGEALSELRRKALEWAVAAADRARALWQGEAAERWRRTAVDLGRRLDVPPSELGSLVRKYVTAVIADTSDVIATAEEGIALLAGLEAPTDADLENLAQIASVKASWEYQLIPDRDGAERTVREALEILEARRYTRRGRGILLHRLGWLFWRAGPLSKAREPLEEAMEILRGSGPGEERWPMHDLGIVLCMRWELRDGFALLERSMELARAASDRDLLMRCYINLPATLAGVEAELQRPAALAAEGLDLARRGLDTGYQYWLANNLASFLGPMGRLDEALDLHAEARATGERTGFRRVGLPEMAWTLTLMGRLDEARATWAEATASEREPEPQMRQTWAMQEAALGWADDPDASIRRLAEAVSPSLDPKSDVRGGGSVTAPARLLVRMAVRAGREPEAAIGYECVRQLHDLLGTPLLGAIRRWLAGLTGPPSAEAVDEIVSAAEEIERLGGRLIAADALADAALVAQRAGAPRGDLVARASDLYAKCGAKPLLEPLDELATSAAVSAPRGRD